MCDSLIIDNILHTSNFNVDKACSLIPHLNRDVATQRVKTIKDYQKKLKKLMKVPVIEQKSEIWYKTRENMISASDFAQALGHGKFGTAKQIIQKKCEPVNESAFSQTNPFFKWGNMFEPVAIEIYSKISGVKVHAFGLIKHPKYDFFGASPDGIDELGRMVEIKCPMKRNIIKGTIPTQYEYQMQGQLDVCDLDECYYFECTFGTFNTIEEVLNVANTYNFIGVIVENQNCEFVYSDVIQPNKNNNYFDYMNSFLSKNNKGTPIFWVLKDYNLQLVTRDKKFMDEKIKELRVVWENILYYRANKNQYVLDILNSVDIETESLYKSKENNKPTLKGYSFQDIE